MQLNILYIHSHDTGRYIQPYGYAVETPNLQRLAEEGVLFRKAFCIGPTCSPSRASLLTGQCPHKNGMLGLAHRGFALGYYKKHFANLVKQAGYTTALFGMQHEINIKRVNELGYDYTWLESMDARCVAPMACDYLKKIDKPFFMSVGFFQTHREFEPHCSEDDPRYCMPPSILPDTHQTREDMAAFKTSVRQFDDAVGIILKAFEENGLAGNTLVICTTDHGIAFPGMKCTLKDHGTGVMLLMRGPGGFSGGKAIDEMVTHLDVLPTIYELLNIEKPSYMEGKSIVPLIEGKCNELHEEIFSEVNFHAAYEPQRAVRTNRWKYIKRFDGRNRAVLPNCDDSLSKTLLLDAGLRDRVIADEELYDLVFDPQEANNIVNEPDVQDVLDDMRKRLRDWMQDTDDPLIRGAIHAPDGAIVDDPDWLSPS